MSFLTNLQIVLVRAANPVNIGQAARAMRNFGLSELVLVRSVSHRVQEAYTPGWKAKQILDRALCFNSLEEALKGSALAIGFTTRTGKRRGEARPFSELVPQVMEVIQTQKVALIFGNERNGLSNEELKQCSLIATLPAAKDYSALNLSHAVAIAAFSVFQATTEAKQLFRKPERFYAKPEEFQALMADVYEWLTHLNYKNTNETDLLSRVHEQLERYFRKGGLERRELHVFKALLSRTMKQLARK